MKIYFSMPSLVMWTIRVQLGKFERQVSLTKVEKNYIECTKQTRRHHLQRIESNRLMRKCMNKVFQTGTVGNTGTLDSYSSMPVENPTMDERPLVLKSSDSVKQELLYKDHFH